jgi:hypothetical protein
MATQDMDTPAPQFKQTWGIERAAQFAAYEAWRTGAAVRLTYRGAVLLVEPNKLISQIIAEYRAAKTSNI